MKVYDLIARQVVREGVTAAFGLLGDTNMEIWGALAASGEVTFHDARHEGTALTMADGYSRAGGGVPICTVTAGPGLVNCGVALTSAARARTPLVLITGQHSRDDTANLQWFDHEGFTRLTGAAYVPLSDPSAAADAVRRAFQRARSERTPVVLDVPSDVQHADAAWFDDDVEPQPVPSPSARIRPDPDAVARAVDLIETSARPVIVAGEGVVTARAVAATAALAQEIGALLATTLPARGSFADDPGSVGIAGLFSVPHTAELLAEADLAVGIGASLNHYTIEGGYLFPDARTVHIDVRPPYPTGTGEMADCFVQGDALATVEALRVEVARRTVSGTRWRTAEVLEGIADAPVDTKHFAVPPGCADPRAVCERLDSLLPPDCGMVMGAGHFWGFPLMHMRRGFSPQVFTHQFGSIGQAPATAVGASLACPGRPVLLLDGDGSTMMNAHVLEALAAEPVRVLAVVLNDGALGAEYHKLRAKGFDPELATTPATDLAELARAWGCRAVTVTEAAQLDRVVAEFLASEGSLLVDVRTSTEVLSLPYRRLHFAQEE